MTVSIILLGAGLIGRRHAELLASHPNVDFSGIVDPAPSTSTFAASLGVPCFASLEDVDIPGIEGAVIATPNASHTQDAIAAASRGWAVLVEKPVAESVDAAIRMAQFFEEKDVPLLVGHHRRHHPFVTKTRELLNSGAIGQLTLVSILWAVRKHDTYFEADWRKQPGAGPVFINLIHEIDLLRYMCGEITDVQAMTSNAIRGHAVEDSAAVLLRLESGALATIAISDAALSPWSFEAASGENPNIALSQAHSWRFAGTAGALEFPTLRLWSDSTGGAGDWSSKLTASTVQTEECVPLVAQLDHFLDVIGKRTEPLVSGADAGRSLEITQRIVDAATSTAA